MSLLVKILFLSALSFSLSQSTPPFIQFEQSSPDPNHLTLECYVGETAEIDRSATFELFSSPTDPPHGNVVPDANGNAIFEVTPESEAFIRCTTSSEHGSMQSGFVAIAAVPTSLPRNLSVAVFNNNPEELQCSIPLGNLYNHLNPYRFHWELVDNRDLSVQVDPISYSNNNRTLTIPVNDLTQSNRYRCVLLLNRCDINCGPMRHEGPFLNLDIYETSRIITQPEQQQVSADEVATFTCSGVGSFINISWEYSEVCSDGDCDNAVVTSESVLGDQRNRQINSTLMINTSLLNISSTGGEYSATIRCTLHQNIPPMINLQGRDQIFSAKLQISDIPVPPSPSTTTTDSTSPDSITTLGTMATTVESPSSNNTVTDSVSRIWIIAVTVIIGILILTIIIAVILVLVFRSKHKGKRRYYMDSNSPEQPPLATAKPKHRFYEELDGSHFQGTENNYCTPFQRQIGIEFDPSNPKADNFSIRGSDDQCSKSGGGASDVSGLSGVSNNIPGAHKMPTYHESSVVSAADSFLAPPQLWERRFSGGSRGTQSTIVPPLHHHDHHSSATEVGHRCSCSQQMPTRYASHEGINIRESALIFREKHYPQQQYCDLPPYPYASHTSLYSKGSDHSSSQFSHHYISDSTLLTVVNCLMHNEDCEIPDCPCRQLQNRYKHLEASKVPLQQKKSPERRRKKHHELPISSSTESDSDVPSDDRSSRKANMHLKLRDDKKLHPHYHLSAESHHMGRTRSRASRRRSRSLSDLTPITETGETPTPQMGGAIKAGTPIHCDRTLGDASTNKEVDLFQQAKQELLQPTQLLTPISKSPLLLREISLSSDNLPVLCLNNCPLQLRTPSPLKSKGRNLGKRNSNKPVLEPLQENSNSTETDDSNTSSRSCSETEMEASKSDYDEGIQMSLDSQNTPLDRSSFHPVNRGESSGYESEANTASVANYSLQGPGVVKGHTSPSSRHSRSPFGSKSNVSVGNSIKSQVSPSLSLRRSCSPFETETTVSCDGTIIKTTEC